MNLRLITTAALLTISSAALAADGSFVRTFTVGSSPDLYVSTGSGSIRVHHGNGNSISITGHVHAGWNATGDISSRIQQIVNEPPVRQEGSAIHVGETNDRSLYNNITIDYEVTAPDNVALNLHSGSGDVQVDGVGRFISAASGSGSVRAHQIHGPADLSSGSGDIELEDTAAGDVKARTGSGSIRIHGFDGSLNAKTGSGDIEGEGNLHGSSMITSGSGSIRLHLSQSAKFDFTATTGSGDIRLNFPGAPQQDKWNRHHITASINGGGTPLEVHTGSGDIQVDGGYHS